MAQVVYFLKIFSGVDYNLKVSPYGQLPLELALMEALLPAAQAAPVVQAQPAQTPRPAQSAATTPPTRPAPASTPAQPRSVVSTAFERAATPPLPAATPEAPQLQAEIKVPDKVVEAVVNVSVTEEPGANLSETELVEIAFDLVQQSWPKVVKSIDAQSKIIAALLKEARPTANKGSQVMLSFDYEFHYKQFKDNTRNRTMVEDHFTKVIGQKIIVKCLFDGEDKDNGGGSGPSSGSNGKGPNGSGGPGGLPEDEKVRKALDIFNARSLD